MNELVASTPNRAARRSFARKGAALGSAAVVAGGATTAFLAAFAMPASATTLTVDSTGDGVADALHCTNGTVGDCTLRDALAAGANGDTITFDASVTGTITLSQGQLQFASAVSVAGPGAGVLTVDAATNSRVFYVGTAVTGDVSISGLTISGGSSPAQGAGIFAGNAGAVTLDALALTGNSVTSAGGGAVQLANVGNASILNSTITQNSATQAGGGVRFDNLGTAAISGSTISQNSAGRGGGVYVYGSPYTVSSVTITDSTIDSNSSNSVGGGVQIYGPAALTMSNTTVSGNSAASRGGGIVLGTQTSHIHNSTIANNTALAGGGVVVPATGTLTAMMSTISGNSATGSVAVSGVAAAGGVAADVASTDYFYGVILSGNISGDSTISDMGFVGNSNTGILDTHHCVFGNVSGQTVYAEANVYSTDPGLAALADNGGPTKTMALLSGSVAIDAGPNPVPSFTGDQYDQRGAGFPRIVNGRSDIGAFEYVATPEPTTTTTVADTTTTTGSDPVVPAFTG